MPIETDLKSAYATLYDKKDPETALSQYDSILKQNPESISALVYKAACLEKLYFSLASWHNELTLENANDLLYKALKISERRGDRSKIAFVYFRLFIHYFNNHAKKESLDNFNKAKQYGYDKSTISFWESKLNSSLEKWKKKGLISDDAYIWNENDGNSTPSKTIDLPPSKTTERETFPEPSPSASILKSSSIASNSTDTKITQIKPSDDTTFSPIHEKVKKEWYQTPSTVVISLFTTRLPESVSSIHTELNSVNNILSLSWSLAKDNSEFQYSIKLSNPIINNSFKFKKFTKKLEITIDKLDKGKTWKTLESTDEKRVDADNVKTKKQKDWSKINFDEYGDDLEDNNGSADAFFQKLYANADPDTKKAMMKSFIESNGTTLNTNWEDVKNKKVEPSPPEGMELKHW